MSTWNLNQICPYFLKQIYCKNREAFSTPVSSKREFIRKLSQLESLYLSQNVTESEIRGKFLQIMKNAEKLHHQLNELHKNIINIDIYKDILENEV